MRSERTLIIVRHAHRDKDLGREADNGLSGKGKRQAERIRMHFVACGYADRARKQEVVFASSPKRRCVETLLPLVGGAERSIEVLDCLDEGEPLRRKVDEFVAWWEKRAAFAGLVVACSHGDWIPEAAREICGQPIELKKGAWLRVEFFDDGDVRSFEVIQRFR
jgi:broad specificity phosphatase PhoE